MPWPIVWNGVERDFDPTDFTTRELTEIKRVSGVSGLMELIEGLQKYDPDVIRAIFWTVDRRDNAELRFGDYDGPTMRLIIANIGRFDDGFGSDGDEPGKASAPTTDGSPSSPNDSDTPDETSTS